MRAAGGQKCASAFDRSKDWPMRHEIAYPAHVVGHDVRHTFLGVYRILYVVTEDCVTILSVRHGARQPLTPDDVRQLGR
jgi:hypothetical protein